MSTKPARGFHIVVGYDFSDQAQLALVESLALARQQEAATIHIIGVLEPARGLGRITHSGTITFTEAERAQKEIEKAVEAEGGDFQADTYRLIVHTRIGTPAKEILSLADETDADLIVVGTHARKGVSRLLLGSVAEQIMRNAHCPILVMRPKEHRSDAERADESLRPEPPCPRCVAQRVETRGAQWWCTSHSKVHPHPRIGGSRMPQMDDWSRFNR